MIQAFSWGFGGYGRLGHAETGDELVPRRINYLDQKNRGIRDVACGNAFNIAMSEIKGIYIFCFNVLLCDLM